MCNRYQNLLIEARNILKQTAVYVVPIKVSVTGIVAKSVSTSPQRHRHGTHNWPVTYLIHVQQFEETYPTCSLVLYRYERRKALKTERWKIIIITIIIIIIISTEVTWL